jgi:hypothetical protein
VQIAFRSALESLDPPITGRTEWAEVERRLDWMDVFSHLAADEDIEIFEEVRDAAREGEAVAQASSSSSSAALTQGRPFFEQAAPAALDARAASNLSDDDELAMLDALRQEQVRLLVVWLLCMVLAACGNPAHGASMQCDNCCLLVCPGNQRCFARGCFASCGKEDMRCRHA